MFVCKIGLGTQFIGIRFINLQIINNVIKYRAFDKKIHTSMINPHIAEKT